MQTIEMDLARLVAAGLILLRLLKGRLDEIRDAFDEGESQ